jgi:glutaredoxin-like protein
MVESKGNEPFIKEKDKKQLLSHFENLQNPVTLLFFTQEIECHFCSQTHKILSEVADLSPLINLIVYDFKKDAQKVSQFAIDKIPATAVLKHESEKSEKDYGIRFFGIPSGYEFMSLILAITAASQGISSLQPATKEKLASITENVHIQVFATLTCPYCPQAVTTAHQFAIESEHIRADMVESVEFPYLVNKYDVFAVPKVIINETHAFEGVIPEERFADEIIKAIQ